MFGGRDRILALFLAAQLVVAIAFGAVLVHALRKPATTTTRIVSESGPVATGAAKASAAPSTAGHAGTVTTKVVGGSAGSAGTSGVAGSGGLSDKGSGAGATGIAAGAPLTFGSVVTQNFSISFTASRQGTAAYLSMINAQGGANGHKINMIYDDDEGSNSTGLNEVNSLVAQKVFALAAFNAPETEGSGLTPILDQNQIPLIGSYGESSEYKDPYAFAFTADYVHFGYEEGKFLVEKGSKVPAFMFVDNSPDENANDEIERGFKDGITAAGGNASKAVFDVVSPTNVSYSSDVTTFMQDGVDGFASILDNTGYVRLLQAQAQNNYYPTEVADPLFDLESVKSQADTGSHPVYVASDLDFLENKAPMVQQYVNAVTALGETPSYLGEAGWIDAEYLVQAIDKLGTTFTRTQLLAAVNSLTSYNNGFTAPLHIAAGSHDMNRCVKFGEISNAVLTQVQGWTCDTETP